MVGVRPRPPRVRPAPALALALASEVRKLLAPLRASLAHPAVAGRRPRRHLVLQAQVAPMENKGPQTQLQRESASKSMSCLRN